MENCAAVERAVAALAADGILPTALAFGEIDEILGGNRRFVFEQPANNFSFRGIKGRVCSCLTGHKFPFYYCGNLGEAFGRAAGLGEVDSAGSLPAATISMWLMDTGVSRRLFEPLQGTPPWQGMRAIFLTRSTVAPSHWPKIV